MAYLEELLQDDARMARLGEALIRCDQSEALDQGMAHAFGDRLQTFLDEINVVDAQTHAEHLEWQLGHIREFANGLRR